MQTPRLPPVDEGYAIRRCVRRHSRSIATITGLFLSIGFAAGAVVMALPAGPAKMATGAFSVLCLVAGVIHRIVTKGRLDRIEALLGPSRSELAHAKRVGHVVELVDTDGVTRRLLAPSDAAARALVDVIT